MMSTLALIMVVIMGFYFVGLAVVSLWSPAHATRFLSGFASSAPLHHLELALRLVAGGAIVLYAPRMLFSGFFTAFGWILVVTTLVLFAIPWRWHHRFAQWAVPQAIDQLKLVAVASLVLGGFVLASVILGG